MEGGGTYTGGVITEVDVPLVVALSSVLLLGLGCMAWLKVGLTKDSLVSVARAVAQLSVATLIITAAVTHLALSILAMVVMLATATYTTTKRIQSVTSAWWCATLALFLSITPTIAALCVTGSIPLNGLALIPLWGILLGNSMDAHTLFGRTAFMALRDERNIYEQYLALGIRERIARAEVVHPKVPEALVTGIDTIKTTGVVKLPGAFIGVILGGGSPMQAAIAQIAVLVGILTGRAIVVAVAYHCTSRGWLRPTTQFLVTQPSH